MRDDIIVTHTAQNLFEILCYKPHVIIVCVCVCDCVWTYAPNRKTESLSGDSVEHDSETKAEEKRAVTTNGILCFLI